MESGFSTADWEASSPDLRVRVNNTSHRSAREEADERLTFTCWSSVVVQEVKDVDSERLSAAVVRSLKPCGVERQCEMHEERYVIGHRQQKGCHRCRTRQLRCIVVNSAFVSPRFLVNNVDTSPGGTHRQLDRHATLARSWYAPLPFHFQEYQTSR